MLPAATLTHFSPGRVRIKIPSKKGDAAYFSSLRDRFSQFPGVQNIEVNPLTGSVLVLHSIDMEAFDAKAVAEYTEFSGLFRLDLSGPGQTTAAQALATAYQDTNRKVEKLTDGAMDVPTMTFAGLLGFGLWEIGRGNAAAPNWHTAFWYGLNIFLMRSAIKRAGANQPASNSL